MEQNQTFTVFVRYAFFNNRSGTGFDGLNLPELIEAASAFAEGHEPVAWAAEGTMGFGGFKHPDQLRAESIAAGRLIECIDGKYIARIPGEVGFDFKREDEAAPSLGKLLRDALARGPVVVATKTPTLDKLENTTERVRPALDWATVKQFDPFPGYRVTSDTEPMVDATDHPLQRLQLADPACGSAHLLGQGK